MRIPLAFWFCLVVSAICAQNDGGVSVGVAMPLMGPNKKEGHYVSRFSDVEPTYSMAFHYRRDRPKRTNLGYELQFTRRAFSTYYSNGSVAGSQGVDVSTVLLTAHVGLLWRTRTDADGELGFFYGFQVGSVVGGSMSGRSWNSYPYQWSEELYEHAFPGKFGMSLRGSLGVWHLIKATDQGSLYVEPNVSVSVLTLCEFGFGSRSFEPGLRLGWMVHWNENQRDR